MTDSTAAASQKNFIDNLYDQFANARVADGEKNKTYLEYLNDKIKALGDGDSANPAKLAEYQKAIMVYTVHLNAQSSMIKSVADLDKGIVHQFN